MHCRQGTSVWQALSGPSTWVAFPAESISELQGEGRCSSLSAVPQYLAGVLRRVAFPAESDPDLQEKALQQP